MADTEFDPSEMPGTAEYDHRADRPVAQAPVDEGIPREITPEPEEAPVRSRRRQTEAPDAVEEAEPPADAGPAGEEN